MYFITRYAILPAPSVIFSLEELAASESGMLRFSLLEFTAERPLCGELDTLLLFMVLFVVKEALAKVVVVDANEAV